LPSKRHLLEVLKYEVEVKGEGEHRCYYGDVEKEQAVRAMNDKKQTRFVLPTDDWELCARLNAHKQRIYKKTHNKAIMLSLMEKAWAEALSDSELDRVMAALDAVEHT